MKKPAPQIDFQEFVFDFMEEASWEEEHGDKEYVSLTADHRHPGDQRSTVWPQWHSTADTVGGAA